MADKNDGVLGAVAVPDDGARRAGHAAQFVDNGDGTITDMNTGLMWEKKDDHGGLHDLENTYAWSGNGSQETIWDWLDDVNAEGAVGLAGYDDWRVPNVNELWSIVDYGLSNPAVNPIFHSACTRGCSALSCSCTMPVGQWTATSSSDARAYTISFLTGAVFSLSGKEQLAAVRAVRGSAAESQSGVCRLPATGRLTSYAADKNDGIAGAVPVPDDASVSAGAAVQLVDNRDGTITDLNTGLMWEKKERTGGLHEADHVFRWSGDGGEETIWDWLDKINRETHPVFGGLGFAGYNDWRIPNANELWSIRNFEDQDRFAYPEFHNACTAACSLATCSCTGLGGYWSSTTLALDATAAHQPGGVAVSVSNKGFAARARAVRGGP